MADLPPEQPLSMPQLNYCVSSAAKAYPGVSPLMLKTVLAVEGGQVGTIRKNTDGSLDLGPGQINTVHLKDIAKEFGYTARDILQDPCKNIRISAWLLHKHLKKADGSHWLAMGNYHSKTPEKRSIYLRKIAEAYTNLVTGIRSGREAEAIGRTVNWGKSQDSAQVPSLALLESIIDGKKPESSGWMQAPKPAFIAKKSPPPPKVVEINNRRKTLRFVDNE